MTIDGRRMASDMLARVKARAAHLSHPPRVVAIIGNETPATVSYLKIKKTRAEEAGCVFETRPLGASFTDADAAIIQLPLPNGVNQKQLCDAIPIEQDADVLGSIARQKFEHAEPDALLPPVVSAIAEICTVYGVELKGKRAMVVGEGWLVGSPAALWLRQQGAVVSVLTVGSDLSLLTSADIIVSGAGSPRLIKPQYLKEGVVLIDAGTSESGGQLAGDADPACEAKCSVFTPVPGGVGPIAVACLFDNVVTLAERANSSILFA